MSGGLQIFNGPFIVSEQSGISAAGTGQGDATVLSASINEINTVTSGQGVSLPDPKAGQIVYITNKGANPVLVYPTTGGQINSLGVDTPYSQTIGTTVTFIASSPTQWYISSNETGSLTYITPASITPDISVTTMIAITALANGLTINNPTGAIVNGQRIIIRIKDTGVSQSLTFGTVYRGSTDLPLPSGTPAGKTMYLGFIYNYDDNKMDLVSFLNNFI